jgi:hypothetical protein
MNCSDDTAVSSACTFAITPHGRLTGVSAVDAPAIADTLPKRLLSNDAQDQGRLLLDLGAEQVGAALPLVIAWWRHLAVRYLTERAPCP